MLLRNNSKDYLQKEKKNCGQKADICPPEIELEQEIELDIEIEPEEEEQNSAATGTGISQNVESVFSYYEMNITKLTDEQRKELEKYSDKMQPELIINAIKEAVDYNAKSYKYVLTILQNCEKQKIFTVDAFLKRQAEHEQQKHNNKNNGPNKPIPFKTYEQREYKNLNSMYMNRK